MLKGGTAAVQTTTNVVGLPILPITVSRIKLEQYLHALHFLFIDRVTPFALEVGVSPKSCGARN